MKATIGYMRNSFAGDVNAEEFAEMLDMLGEEGYQADPDYVAHIQEHHGGKPLTRYFPDGEVERLLNYSDSYVHGPGKRINT